MNRHSYLYPSTQLMTVEEAQQLSQLTTNARRDERRRETIWSWQSVDGVIAQTISDEQVDALAATTYG